MASFVPTSPDTLEDQRLYTAARLVDVACLDCLAVVRVKKNSEQHTAIQWSAEALGHCTEVWCSEFFFTPTWARQSRHATSTRRAEV